jgi:sulfofructose kinase
MDTILGLPSWPNPDGRVVADGFVRGGGGPAATAAVALARLGRRVALIGAVGDDEVGESVRAGLEREGVDIAGLEVVPGRTAESVILLDRSRGTRSILHVPGATAQRPSVPSGAQFVHVDHVGYGLAGSVEPGRLSVDAGNPIDALSLDGIALYAPTAEALRSRYPGLGVGAAVQAALDEGAERVAITLGSAGALAADRSGAWRVAGVDLDVVSTLGAGDVFHGALLAMLLAVRPLGDALQRANLAAALSCRALDGRSAIPTKRELEDAVAASPPLEPVVLEQVA